VRIPRRLLACHRQRFRLPFQLHRHLSAARASPDGYTLVVVSASNTINATLHEDLNVVLRREIAPVAGLVKVQLVMEVNTSFPAHSVPEFIAYAKANPGEPRRSCFRPPVSASSLPKTPRSGPRWSSLRASKAD
jgi:Tripartite tricarboxylate transporter family receptor